MINREEALARLAILRRKIIDQAEHQINSNWEGHQNVIASIRRETEERTRWIDDIAEYVRYST